MQRPSVSTGILSMVRPIDRYRKSLSIFSQKLSRASSYVVFSKRSYSMLLCFFFRMTSESQHSSMSNSLEGRMALRGYFHQDSLSPVPCHWEAATGRRGDLGVMPQGRLSEVLKANPGKQS